MPITFETDAQRVTYAKVAAMLKEEYGRTAQPYADRAAFALMRGSALVQVYVEPIRTEASCIRVLSWVVTGAERTPELHEFLLKLNLTVRFGAFGVDDSGDIMFTHAIHGESATHETLMFSVGAVGVTADDYDDAIVQRFGGQRAVDRG